MKTVSILGVLALLTGTSLAQGTLSGVNGDCAIGGQQVITQGLPSTATQPIGTTTVSAKSGVIASYPKCTVTVYLTGTVTTPPIYQDNLVSPTPLSNPFTANTDGSYTFFVAQSCPGYDIVLSSGTGPAMPTVRTLTDVCTGGTGGGGGGVSGSGTSPKLPIWTGSTSLGNSTLSQIGVGQVQMTMPSASNIGGLCPNAGQFQISSTVVVAPDGIYFNPLGTSTSVAICAANTSGGLGTSIDINAGNGSNATGGGQIGLQAGSTGFNNGAQVEISGSSSFSGGILILAGGAGLVGGDVQLQSGGITAGGTVAGNIDLITLQGATTAGDGVVYIRSNNAPFNTAYFYLFDTTFSALTVPPNGFAGNNHGALCFCHDCKGPQDSVVWGSVAANSGTGSLLMYDGTNWRVH